MKYFHRNEYFARIEPMMKLKRHEMLRYFLQSFRRREELRACGTLEKRETVKSTKSICFTNVGFPNGISHNSKSLSKSFIYIANADGQRKESQLKRTTNVLHPK